MPGGLAIVNQLVLHHHYTYGSTFDVSTFGNHGQPHLVAAGSGMFSSALHFAEGDSRVVVAPSASLSNPFSIAAMARFYLDSPPVSRLNIIEGYVSFALYIDPDGALTGTIVDADGDWRGASSAAGVVGPPGWHEVWLVHDGVSQIELRLDGATVAAAIDVVGPVRSIGDLGISIGNWPDAGAYAFTGFIDEVKFYRYDSMADFQSLLNPCCFDGRAFDEILRELKQGRSSSGAGDKTWNLLAMLAKLAAISRTSDATRTRKAVQISQGLFRAIRRRDIASVTALQSELGKVADGASGAQTVIALQQQLATVMGDLGVSEELLLRLADAMCLAVPTVDPQRPREGRR
jgi:hypothetical protein